MSTRAMSRSTIGAIGVAVLTAGAVVVMSPGGAAGANGQALILGQRNQAADTTILEYVHSGIYMSDLGLHGSSSTRAGLLGVGFVVPGVIGRSLDLSSTALAGDGVVGETGTASRSGVYGNNTGPGGFGVTGRAPGAAGVGVQGDSAAGTGVLAASASGTALRVQGSANFTSTITAGARSGIVTLAAGANNTTKFGVSLTGASIVLATLQTNAGGLYVQSAVPNVGASSFRITLSKAVPAGQTAKVAWFIVN